MTTSPSTPPPLEITPAALKRRLDAREPGLILVDCRRPDEYAICRINGSRLIPLADIVARAEDLETDDGGRSAPIVVHCHMGVRSMKATLALRELGFPNVQSLAGGIDAWSIQIDPTVPRY